jgi:hypothetical protein
MRKALHPRGTACPAQGMQDLGLTVVRSGVKIAHSGHPMRGSDERLAIERT